MTQTPRVLSLTLVALALAGCAAPAAHQMAGSEGHMGMTMGGKMAMATLSPTQGSTVRGLVMFHEMDGHVMVHAQLSGLKPNAEQGFHVHETGNCASADGSSAGGHFNPDAQPHGPQNAAHHKGDLPALKADADGRVDQKFELMGPTLADGPASLVGRSVIVHAQADDYSTQPTGNSGARAACGVIAAH
jgi:Cu-Zn family superoxide dismutase